MPNNIADLKGQLKALQKKRKEREIVKRLRFGIIGEKISGSRVVRVVKDTVEFAGQLKKANKKIVPNVRDVVRNLPQ